MNPAPTPGETAYAAYCARLYQHRVFVGEPSWLAWGLLSGTERAAWEAAAQAVLALHNKEETHGPQTYRLSE